MTNQAKKNQLIEVLEAHLQRLRENDDKAFIDFLYNLFIK
jgi:hypothetical protein